ncbi:MAG TPA: DUF3108 domain-containing protein [Polaromonas sp.]|uniref:DUF3108 domain-containing protein n=1 Tax=Polaromonas sp. TaxID=1869339 RepID=UPI002D4F39F7|nr:DUF3108 domain-containing protein [Polaromonas sp.]HYW57104.1 DUF3108 domain-containing protein [Polaromonas sp.]
MNSAPPMRPLLLLTAAVLLAHVLLLQAAPMQWSQHIKPDAIQTRPFITRTIEIKPPAVVAAAPAPPTVAPARTSRPNKPPALAPRSPTAPELIANSTPVADQAETTVAATPPPVLAPAEVTPPPPAAAVALSIPGSARLVYAMTGRSKNLNYTARAELEWLHDGANYNAKIVVSALFLGSRTMTSSGRINEDGLAPTRFSDKSRGERAAHFEADKGKISFSANTPDAPWLRGAQDRVSVFLQLGSMLAGDPGKYPVGSTVSLYTAGPREAATWTFNVEAEETLNLPVGEVSTLKLTRKPQGDYDQTLEIWFAPSVSWLPVRNRITQHNGDYVDQQLRAAEKP